MAKAVWASEWMGPTVPNHRSYRCALLYSALAAAYLLPLVSSVNEVVHVTVVASFYALLAISHLPPSQ
jgi:hypothetical protein